MRRAHGAPITEADLLERRRQLHSQLKRVCLFQLLLLPVILPLSVLGLFVRLVTMPWLLRKASRLAKEAIGKRDHEKLLRAIPDHMEFVVTQPSEYTALDRQGLQDYTQGLEALGFVHVVDYSVRYPGHETLSKRPPGFARLWIHPVHRCFAEVNQTFGKEEASTPVRCLVASWLENDWDLTTTDRKLEPIFYVWRRPRSLWSRHPWMSPADLLAEHLRRRQRMMDVLGIVVISELTPEAYFARVRKNNADHKEVLQVKNIETIRAEMRQCERSPIHEWSGELPVSYWGTMLFI
jgi:hypothetical protein